MRSPQQGSTATTYQNPEALECCRILCLVKTKITGVKVFSG
jgi:hypothetical protein